MHPVDDAIGAALYIASAALLFHGLRARRLRRIEMLAPDYEPMSPMMFAAGEIMRPILQICLGYAAIKTGLMYYMLGGPKLMPLYDFLGLPVFLAAYGIWLTLKLKPLAEPKSDRDAPAPTPRPALPPELIPQTMIPVRSLDPVRSLELTD